MDTIAYCVNENTSRSNVLHEFSTIIGFTQVSDYIGLAQVEKQSFQTPIMFFIFEQVSDIRRFKNIVSQIRACKRHNIRFSPLIYLCNIPSPQTIKNGIAMGFDDVIAKPFNFKKIKTRLDMQVDKIIPYYETSDYFGPDRRKFDQENSTVNPNKRKNMQYLQYKFIRNLNDGIIIKDKKMMVS